MGDEYTPTTVDVRAMYAEGRAWDGPDIDDSAHAEFDRWLAEHDAQVIESARNRLTGHEAPGPQLQAMADKRRAEVTS